MGYFSVYSLYMSRFGLCWRCTQSGTSSDPDVVLLRWAFWVQGDLILIYYWGGLRSAAPMGGGPCSEVLRHEGGQCTGAHATKQLVG